MGIYFQTWDLECWSCQSNSDKVTAYWTFDPKTQRSIKYLNGICTPSISQWSTPRQPGWARHRCLRLSDLCDFNFENQTKIAGVMPLTKFFSKILNAHIISGLDNSWMGMCNGNFDCQGHNSPMPGSCSKAWTTSLPSCWTHRRTTWTTLLAAVTIKLRDEQYLN